MKIEAVWIPAGEGRSVSGTLAIPDGYAGKTGIILAHGAGNDKNHPMLVFLGNGLAQGGYITLRFNFLYREQGRASPDGQEVLYQVWESACNFLHDHPRYRPQEIIAGGKSLGGRMASQMVAEGRLPVSRLIFFGYPLHAPGKKDQPRDAHLYEIALPMLFFAGTRDPLCDLDLLKTVLSRLAAHWELEVIEGGDHSFVVPRAYRTGQQEVYERILSRTLDWLEKPAD